MNISTVVATTYMDVNKTGRNRPCTFSCVDEDNRSDDYFVKFHGSIDSLIICEFVGSILGRALGVNVPNVAIVYIDDKMQSNIHDHIALEMFLKKSGPHFGSQNVGQGYMVMNSGYNLVNESLAQALNIFAFDMLVQNADRTRDGTVGNPNVLFKGNELIAIDHEMSFSFVNLIGNIPEPWSFRNTNLPTRHIFYPQLLRHAKNNTISFDDFIEKLVKISPEYMDSVMQALPAKWYNERYIEKINHHIHKICTNIDQFHDGLLEVFA